jgi:hypothetical protein
MKPHYWLHIKDHMSYEEANLSHLVVNLLWTFLRGTVNPSGVSEFISVFCVVWRFVVADHFVVFSSICITTTQRNMCSRSMIKLTFRNISDCFLQRCVQYTPLSWHLRIFSNDIYKDWNLRKCSVSLEGAMNVIKGMQSIEI